MRNAVGLDISQNTFDAAAIVNGQCKQALFDNSINGFESFKAWLDGFGCELHICMEATGNYFEDVADYIGQFTPYPLLILTKLANTAKAAFIAQKQTNKMRG